MPDRGCAACWSDSGAANPLASFRLGASPRWQGAPLAPAHPPWATAIPAATRVQPDAISDTVGWREHAAVFYCQAPGGVLSPTAMSGFLPRASFPLTLQGSERSRTPDSPPAGWKEPAGSRQAGASPAGSLSGPRLDLALRPANAFWKVTRTSWAEWSAPAASSRDEITAPPSGASLASGRWEERGSSAMSWAAARSAAPSNILTLGSDPVRFRLREPGPVRTSFPPIRMACAQEAGPDAGAWAEKGAWESYPAPSQGVEWTVSGPSMPRSGFLSETAPMQHETAARVSGEAAGEGWQTPSGILPETRFAGELPARRPPRHLAVTPHNPGCAARPAAVPTELTGADWTLAGVDLKLPEQPQPAPNCMARASFWPATGFAIRTPAVLSESSSWSHEPQYLWRLSLCQPEWTGRSPKLTVRRMDLRVRAAERCPGLPLTRMPEACWPPSGWTGVEAVLTPEMPATPSFGRTWKPEPVVLGPGLPAKAESGRFAWGTARWSAGRASVSDIIPPSPGRGVWVAGFSRKFVVRGTAGARFEKGAVQEARAHPERLRLPHLVCRFPRMEPASSMRKSGAGEQVFRFSGILRGE